MIRWSSSVRLDDYVTIKALRRQVALVYRDSGDKKPLHKRNEELASALCQEVQDLNETLRTFGMFSESGSDIRKRVDIMKRIREELGDVFLYSLRVANALDLDVARSVHEKIYPIINKSEKQWKR